MRALGAVAVLQLGAGVALARDIGQDPPPPATTTTAPPPSTTTPPTAPAQTSTQAPAKPAKPQDDSHIFGVLPNYTSVGAGQTFVPMSTRATFAMTAQGAFDKVVFPFTAFTAGVAQWENQEKS